MTAATVDEREVAFAGVAGQAELLRSGRLTSVALVELLLARIERLQPGLNAFRLVLAGEARRAAAEADAARAAGDTRPLLGVPIALKDNIPVAGHAALLGTGSPEPVATADGELAARVRAAGLVVLGLTHLPELALWSCTESMHHGVTRNPWNPRRAPGGSSGGSAAAVAAGMVPAAHATDGLGSIRLPAAACGLVGLKPTHGLVPLDDADHWEGMSHAGFVTRTVRDTALLLDAVVTPSPDLAAGIDQAPAPLRVAASIRVPTPGVTVDAAVRRGWEHTLDLLRERGHTVVVKDPAYGAVSNAATVRYLAGVARDVRHLADPTALEPRTRTLARLGGLVPAGAVSWARRQGEEFAERMDRFFADVDVLVTPTSPVPARAAGAILGKGLTRTLRVMVPTAGFTGPWNACGLPAVSVPGGTTDDGVPIGVQLVGPRGSEARLLAVATQLETAAGWPDRRPPVE